MNISYLLLIALAGVFLAIAMLAYQYLNKPFLTSLNLKLLKIKLQKKDQKDEKDLLKEINLSEQLFNSLSSINKPFAFEVAVHHSESDIFFYLAVPRDYVDFAKRQVQGLFLDATVEETDEYTIFDSEGGSAAAYLKFFEDPILPLRSYRESETDTFAPILSTLSKLDEKNEGAAIQYVFQPATPSVKKSIVESIERLKKGEKFKDVTNHSFISWKDIEKILFAKPKSKEEEDKIPKIIDEDAIKAIQTKVTKPLYYVNVRVVAHAPSAFRAEEILLSIAGAFSQFAAAFRNSFKIVKPSSLKKVIFEYIFREANSSQAMIMNAEELASIFHIPTASSDVPHIDWMRTKEVQPPANLPNEGVVIGVNDFRGDSKLVRLTDADRRRHMYIIGQTGVGKSYGMILPMVEQDMAAGKGLCVIDPHGDLIDDILERVPKDRIDDVIVFDPGDLRRPLGLNMLEYDLSKPEEKSFIVNELLNIFDKLYDLKATGGPMFEYYLRNALLLVLEDYVNDPVTLLDIPRIFSDSEYRNAKLARISNPLVIDFWTKEANKATGEQGLQNMTVYIVSKFSAFISNDYMRPIIGQTKSAFNLRDLMDNQKILLVKLAKGKIGDINANLLGMIITGRILMAALSRSDMKKEDRKDFYFYIDEFQNFTTDSISTILSEARKYGLCLTIAHQFIAQLKDEIRESVFGNVGSMIAFRVGAPDTEALLKHFGPEFSEKDLVSLENRTALAKLLVDGEPSKPFSFHTQTVAPGHSELSDKLQELSRLTYGRDLAEVEQDILGRLNR